MKKVITYGTYDLLHHGHIRLLERAKKLGDYLIVGVTADNFDRSRGKINVRQTLAERLEAIKATGLADEVIVEEYEGQKIDDIKRYGIDVFTVGSDWEGKFDYLKEYCEVIYLERTQGISSSKIRSTNHEITMGLVGDNQSFLNKFQSEDKFVNGIQIIGICTNNIENMSSKIKDLELVTNNYDELLEKVDTVFINSKAEYHYEQIKKALIQKKHVLYSSPLTTSSKQAIELIDLAKKNNCILMEAIRTAYSTAFARLLLLLKTGIIGNVLSIDATCTSLRNKEYEIGSLEDWGPEILLTVFQVLGTDYIQKNIITKINAENDLDIYTQINFIYKNATATVRAANGAKSEGELIITGTKGYVVVPAPWWKTDYFEVRYENSCNNKRYFYQLDGEGIRYELVTFVRCIQEKNQKNQHIDLNIINNIVKIMEDFNQRKDTIVLE